MFEWYIVADRGVLFHVTVAGNVVGYCAGIRIHQPGLPGAFTSIAQHSFWAFVWAYVKRPWLLLHPENFKKRSAIIRNILLRCNLYRSPQLAPAFEKRFRTHWGLVAIGVNPSFQGQGYGGVLLEEFERLARADGVEHIELSVKVSNSKAIACYVRNGWSVVDRSVTTQLMQKQITVVH